MPETTEQRLAPLMFTLSVLFLVLLAGVLHLHESPSSAGHALMCGYGTLALYPLFWIDAAIRYFTGKTRSPFLLIPALIPPARIATRDATGRMLWLPGAGWIECTDESAKHLSRRLSTPMMLVALLVLPVMAAEYMWADYMVTHPHLSLALSLATGLIWLAFSLEFMVMVGITNAKLRYARTHWIDVVVILLPLVAFLRAVRLGRLLRLQQMTKTVRIYRLRGTAMKLYHAILLVDAVDRLVRGGPERQLQNLTKQLQEREKEVERIRTEIQRLESQITAARQTAPS